MDALLGSRRVFVREFASTLRLQLARQGALLLFVLLLGAALTLGLRRATGALERPLATSAMCAVAALLATAAVLLRYAVARMFSRRASLALLGVATIGLLVVGWALSLPHSSSAGLSLFWVVLIAGELAAWGPWSAKLPARGTHRHVSHQVDPESTIESLAPSSEEPARDGAMPHGLRQQITRTRADDGTDTVTGWLGVDLAAGQRTASAHVAFCPPFARVPQIQLLDDGGVARVKLAQVLPHGARFDVKLYAPAEEPFVLPLRFSATCGA